VIQRTYTTPAGRRSARIVRAQKTAASVQQTRLPAIPAGDMRAEPIPLPGDPQPVYTPPFTQPAQNSGGNLRTFMRGAIDLMQGGRLGGLNQ
jgi:hypothetical protein